MLVQHLIVCPKLGQSLIFQVWNQVLNLLGSNGPGLVPKPNHFQEVCFSETVLEKVTNLRSPKLPETTQITPTFFLYYWGRSDVFWDKKKKKPSPPKKIKSSLTGLAAFVKEKVRSTTG